MPPFSEVSDLHQSRMALPVSPTPSSVSITDISPNTALECLISSYHLLFTGPNSHGSLSLDEASPPSQSPALCSVPVHFYQALSPPFERPPPSQALICLLLFPFPHPFLHTPDHLVLCLFTWLDFRRALLIRQLAYLQLCPGKSSAVDSRGKTWM